MHNGPLDRLNMKYGSLKLADNGSMGVAKRAVPYPLHKQYYEPGA